MIRWALLFKDSISEPLHPIDAAPTCFATLHLAGLRRSLASVNLFDQTKLEKQIGRSLDGSVVKVSMN